MLNAVLRNGCRAKNVPGGRFPSWAFAGGILRGMVRRRAAVN
jgi:hypothetical protein